ncbi:hypothetical protein PIB30_071686, partial [Stylosanthes scabra]|nr:hypothetical protein [Stylosanthes scabra]
GNPFAFLGCDENEALSVLVPMIVDPFKNNTPNIEGIYEWLKMILGLPIAILKLCFLVCVLPLGILQPGWCWKLEGQGEPHV